MGSLGGILNTLQGNGIAFKKLSSNLVYANNLIELKDAKAVSQALGISADGTINFNDSALNLRGAIVPMYALNSLLNNIPIVGDILTGGEGIFAFTYSVEGKYTNPKVSVNPLSVLTPGFLRKLFN